MKNHTWKLLLGAPLFAGLVFACGPETEESTDQDAVQQAVTESVQGAVDSIIDGLALLESSQMFDESGFGEDCYYSGSYDNNGEWVEEEECYQSPPLSQDVDEVYDEFGHMLETRIFTEGNVESSDNGTVMYLLRGSVVCDADDFYMPEDYDYCVNEVDAVEIRLFAEFDSAGVLSLDVLLGPDQIHPLTLKFSSQQLSVTTVLDNFEATAQYIMSTFDDEELEDFVDRLEGEVEFGYFVDGDDVEFAIHIHEAIGIEADDFALDIAGVGKVLAVGFNLVEETMNAAVGLGELSFSGEFFEPDELLPVEFNSDPDEYEEPVESEPYYVDFEMAGLTSTVTFDPSQDIVEWSNVSLGNGPTRLDINGENVLNIDLNASMGRMFDAVMELKDDGLEAAFEPGFELDMETRYHRVEESYDDYEEWMLDDLIKIVLDGDQNPAIMFGEYGLEILRGQLSFSSESHAGITVDAGMCLIDNDDWEEESSHPFDDLEAGMCEE